MTVPSKTSMYREMIRKLHEESEQKDLTINTLKRQNYKAKSALEFYSDDSNWNYDYGSFLTMPHNRITLDGGRTAAKAQQVFAT